MFNAKQTHCGQYRPYGDFFRTWEIETDLTQEEVIEKCFAELYTTKVPQKEEWEDNIRYDGKHFGDADYYFRGYYNLERSFYSLVKDAKVYRFTVCEPFAD